MEFSRPGNPKIHKFFLGWVTSVESQDVNRDLNIKDGQDVDVPPMPGPGTVFA